MHSQKKVATYCRWRACVRLRAQTLGGFSAELHHARAAPRRASGRDRVLCAAARWRTLVTSMLQASLRGPGGPRHVYGARRMALTADLAGRMGPTGDPSLVALRRGRSPPMRSHVCRFSVTDPQLFFGKPHIEIHENACRFSVTNP